MDRISVMIVDDERLAVDDLLSLIDWSREGFDIVATAVNGKHALGLFMKLKPQVLITDIRMPRMDGIELIERVREIDQSVKILILTAYRDFEYAKSAIRHGITDYIVKNDVSESTLMEVLDKIRTSIKADVDFNAQAHIEPTIGEMGADGGNRFSPPVLLALEYVRINHINNELTIDEIAGYARVSAGHLRTLFKKETGKTIGEFTTEVRIAESKKLLSSTHLKINEISERVGYSSGRYFSQVFLRHTGTFPSEYRTLRGDTRSLKRGGQ